MTRFIKRPVTINAIQFTGDNADTVISFLNPIDVDYSSEEGTIVIFDDVGVKRAYKNDWIIKSAGNVDIVNQEVFITLYAPIGEGNATI